MSQKTIVLCDDVYAEVSGRHPAAVVVVPERPLDRMDVFAMAQRRAKAAGIRTKIGCHTFRAPGITIYLTNGGDLENAQHSR